MTKRGTKKLALNWVPSSFDDADLKKAEKEGFLPSAVLIIFLGDESVLKPPEGYRVMFLSFLIRGLSLPAHEFYGWASLCLWRAAASAHAKFDSSHCLLCHSV
jgi:hypothetical protein